LMPTSLVQLLFDVVAVVLALAVVFFLPAHNKNTTNMLESKRDQAAARCRRRD